MTTKSSLFDTSHPFGQIFKSLRFHLPVSFLSTTVDSINKLKMKALLFFLQDEVDRFLRLDYHIDCRGTPQQLLRELRNPSSSKKFGRYLTSTSKNPLKMIRGLTICNLLLLHSKDWFSFVEQHLIQRVSRDQWLNDKFLSPYFHFLSKCCTSKENFLQVCTLSTRRGQTFDMLFYCTNMLHLLFRIVEKMPLLGRYYKQQHSELICSAIETIASQAQRLYAGFKHALTVILHNREEYIKGKEEEGIMRGILVEELSIINEEMKKLFLDKYFYPVGKGIGVKLFRPQEQTFECEKTIKGIVSDHENTERQKRHQQLERTLFPGTGQVNWNFYEETLLSGPILNSTISKTNVPNYKELDDIAISEQDQQQGKTSSMLKEQVQGGSEKETNSGTAQQKTYQF